MLKRQLTVQNPGITGVRGAANIMQVSSGYNSQIYIETFEKRVNGMSLLGLVSLNLEVGDMLVLTCEGQDEAAAMNTMVTLF